ncbi:glycosyltransferase [Neobacillus drentensis]|uniref:glycosyltransferase n=1 Tax=Neobacillus drentensis TaxID=220684 RepID=UPI002FFE08B8
MKRILIVTFSMDIGGLENVLMNYYRNISKEEFQIDFLIHKNVDSTFTREIKKFGGNIHYQGTVGELGILKYLKKLISFFRKNGVYDTIHANMEYQSGIVCLAALLAGVKTRLCHAHTTNVSTNYNKYLMPIYRMLTKISATKLIACNKSAGHFMFGNRTFEVLPNAIDVNRFLNVDKELIEDIKKTYNIPSNAILLGHVARLSKEKNQCFLIDILAELSNTNKDYRLIIVGDGEEKDNILNYANSKGILEKVIFTGFRKDINILLKIFDIFLLPSFYEGLPLSVVEAQAAGIKCLLSNNISKEVDLGLDLVEFIPIYETSGWVDYIKDYKKLKLNPNVIETKFKEEFYDIKIAVKKLVSLYNT